MKIKLLFIVLFISILTTNAQVDKSAANEVKSIADTSMSIKEGWTKGASINLNFNQTKLTNWFAGGDRLSVGLNTMFKANTTYKKGKSLFKANLEAAYGMIKTTSSGGPRKTDDRWVLTSSLNRKVATGFYATLAAQVKSQFDRGFSYTEDGSKTLISDFLSPGDIKLGLGLTYQPSKNFSAYLSPATAKINAKRSNAFYSQRIFGVDSFQRYAFDLGAFTRIDYRTNIRKDLTYIGSVDAFYGYILKNYNFYFANVFNWKLNKYFGATFSLDITYDNTQPTPNYVIVNGVETTTGTKTVKMQLKQFFGLGFNYSF